MTYEDVINTVAYFECPGPVSVICPEVSPYLLGKHLSLKRTVTMSVNKEREGQEDENMHNSFVLCASHNANNFVNLLEHYSTVWHRRQWIVLCGNMTCSYLMSLPFFDIGHNILFVNLDTSEITESFTVNNLTQTHILGKMAEITSLNNDQPPMRQQRSNFQGLELITLIDNQYPNIVFFQSYNSNARYWLHLRTSILCLAPKKLFLFVLVTFYTPAN